MQWRPKQLSDLIDCVRRLVTGQYTDADRAICGLDDFVLHKNNAFSVRAGAAAGAAFSSTDYAAIKIMVEDIYRVEQLKSTIKVVQCLG